MKHIQKHIAYLKNNPQGYWFKRKLYGYGWIPTLVQGWAVLLVYVASVMLIVMRATALEVSETTVLTQIVFPALFATVIFLIICHRTGESLKWQWGEQLD
ncbi:MAG: hypothetical protein ACI9H6_000367 [Patiriisocius sp.]|jgi:hypothetical protein